MTDSPRPTDRSTRPAGQRRTTARPASRFRTAPPKRSFLERYRGLLLGGAAVAAIAVVGILVAFNAAEPAYACAQQWQAPASAAPAGSPAPGASPRIGYVQPDLGRNHIPTGQTVNYALCPPASGRHYNATGQGPIKAQLYGPEDTTIPQGWIHNLEHGGLVVLYRCPGPGCDEAGQAAFRQFYASFPASPICKLPVGAVGPVITRFDQMEYPIAVLLWGQVLPLQTWDPALALAFFNQQAERSNPEQACPRPTATPGPSTPAPSGSAPAASPSAPASPAASGSVAPAGSPAAGSPGTSPAPTSPG